MKRRTPRLYGTQVHFPLPLTTFGLRREFEQWCIAYQPDTNAQGPRPVPKFMVLLLMSLFLGSGRSTHNLTLVDVAYPIAWDLCCRATWLRGSGRFHAAAVTDWMKFSLCISTYMNNCLASTLSVTSSRTLIAPKPLDEHTRTSLTHHSMLRIVKVGLTTTQWR
jgi:hypothetical protein